MASKRDYIGNIVSIGNGVKCFMVIKGMYLNTDDKTLKQNGVAIELGIVNDINYNSQRDVAPNYLPGSRDALSFTKGKRLTSGKISLSVTGRDFIDFFVNELLEDPLVKGKLKAGKLFDLDLNKIGSVSKPTNIDETAPVQFKDKKINYLDQLPPVDLVLIARGDVIKTLDFEDSADENILQVGDDFILNAYFKMKLKDVKFLNDNFGISAGSPMQDQILDFIVAGGKETWDLVPQGSGK